MAEFRLTRKAVEDINGIWYYTFEKWSENQADKYYNMLLSFCEELANQPNIGKKYTNILPDLMGFKAQRHIIFYRVIDSDLIEIIRILHERMDISNRMSDPN